ncbi:MAG: FAD-dependent oxidoreductase [Bacteroidales bacterium]
MKIAVIGAGPAGMTAAYELSRQLGDKVDALDVFEKSDRVGGLSRTIELWDQRVDLGPHRFFSHDARINSLWLEVVKDRYEIVNRQTRIYYKRKFFDYPIRPFNALKGLGFFEAARCMISYAGERLSPTRDTSTFEGWVTSRFGKRLYHIFFKTYSEKLWGIPCTELDSDFAAQRIKKLSLLEALRNAFSLGGKNRHATLVDQFAYPTGGTGSVYKAMQETVESRGGRILVNTGVRRVITKNGKAHSLELENGETRQYDHIISSMPISLLVERLPEVPNKVVALSRSLKFRNTILVYLRVERTDLFTDQWLYVHEKSLQMGRVTNFRNWVPHIYGDSGSSILCLEYWCYFEDRLWDLTDDELISLAIDEISGTGLVEREDIKEGHVVKLPRCYPVYFKGYRETMKPVETYLTSVENLHVIGRYGAYKYNNQDHSILMGMLASENILEGTGHNLWSINTDYEVYQEASIITKTGLVIK